MGSPMLLYMKTTHICTAYRTWLCLNAGVVNMWWEGWHREEGEKWGGGGGGTSYTVLKKVRNMFNINHSSFIPLI